MQPISDNQTSIPACSQAPCWRNKHLSHLFSVFFYLFFCFMPIIVRLRHTEKPALNSLSFRGSLTSVFSPQTPVLVQVFVARILVTTLTRIYRQFWLGYCVSYYSSDTVIMCVCVLLVMIYGYEILYVFEQGWQSVENARTSQLKSHLSWLKCSISEMDGDDYLVSWISTRLEILGGKASKVWMKGIVLKFPEVRIFSRSSCRFDFYRGMAKNSLGPS